MCSKLTNKQIDMKLWCANRDFHIDLKPYFLGKVNPAGTKDVYYPFVGQPVLMSHLRPALSGYANTISKSSLQGLQIFLNSFFLSLTQQFPNADASIADINANLVNEQSLMLLKYGATLKTRQNFHSVGNQILIQLHSRYALKFPNLSKSGQPLRYPSIKSGSGIGKSRVIFPDLEIYIKKYCLQVLKNVDDNPFRNVDPIYGTDVMDPSNVMYDYQKHLEAKLCGEIAGTWLHQAANKFPWNSTPNLARMTKAAHQLDRQLGELWCGGWTKQMRDALFPTPDEIIASVLLVTLELGWVDTAKAFRFDGKWYTTFAKNPNMPKGTEYVALTNQLRPKTGEAVWTKASSTREGGSWWVLKRIEKRRELLAALCSNRAAETTMKLDELPTTSADWDKVRLERDRWQDLEHLAFIFLGRGRPTSAVNLPAHIYTKFIAKIPAHANFPIPEELTPTLGRMTHYDLRHLSAERTFRSSGFHATQEMLGHKNSKTTITYLESHQIKAELFAIYAKVAGIAFNEIEQKAVLNRAIIRKRYIQNGADLSTDERRSLGAQTLHGARCKNPKAPPPEAGSESSIKCLDGSCIRCPLAVWNWHDVQAIPLAVSEYARLVSDHTPNAPISVDLDCTAWEALFSQIPPELQSSLNSELASKGIKYAGAPR
jgi:hypothetical protein